MVASLKNMDVYPSMPKQNWLAEIIHKAQAIQELCEESEDKIHGLKLQVEATRNKYTNLAEALTREHSEGMEEGVLKLMLKIRATQNKVNNLENALVD